MHYQTSCWVLDIQIKEVPVLSPLVVQSELFLPETLVFPTASALQDFSQL